jgi:hypothetical protein
LAPPPLASPAPQAPPAPAWSNFQIDVPRPASRLAWLPAYFHTPPKPPGYDAQPYRGRMIGHPRSSCSGRRR